MDMTRIVSPDPDPIKILNPDPDPLGRLDPAVLVAKNVFLANNHQYLYQKNDVMNI